MTIKCCSFSDSQVARKVIETETWESRTSVGAIASRTQTSGGWEEIQGEGYWTEGTKAWDKSWEQTQVNGIRLVGE